jgi:hypothetical protein
MSSLESQSTKLLFPFEITQTLVAFPKHDQFSRHQSKGFYLQSLFVSTTLSLSCVLFSLFPFHA